jgi:hypothetical protein
MQNVTLENTLKKQTLWTQTLFCFQSRLPLRFVRDDDETHIPTNQLRFGGFRKPLPSPIHRTNPDASTCAFVCLSVCLPSKQKLAIAEWGRSNLQFRLYTALGSDSRRSLSEILVYVQKKPSSEMYKILCCQQTPRVSTKLAPLPRICREGEIEL